MTELEDRAYLIMPFLNEATSLPDVLESICAQSIPHEKLFLVAVDSGSIDSGPSIVERFLRRSTIKGVMLQSTARSIPAALNTGFRWVDDRGVTIRLDAHTLYDSEYVRKIVDEFKNRPSSVWCIGGAQTAESSRQFSRAIVVSFMTNPIGLGFSPHRFARQPRFVDNVYLGAFRAGIVKNVGYFDERWRANEDSELMARVVEAGGQILWIPIKSAYRVNRGAVETLYQWMRYGFWRAQTIKRHPNVLGIRHVIPPVALISGATLIISPWRKMLFPIVFFYMLAIVSLRPREERPLVTAASVVYYPVAHSLNAFGLIVGLFTPLLSKNRR